MTSPRVFAMAPGHGFVDALAQGLLGRAGAAADGLADTTILLPTRRSVRALSDAFLRAAGGRALILPRMMPIGDLDEDALVFERASAGAALDLPPAVPDLTRQLLLARMILARRDGVAPDQAALLADALAHLLDEVQTERLGFGGLRDLAPEDFAEHWQRVLRFLDILVAAWPDLLAELGYADPAARRNALLEAQADQWRESPPATPVIAAGSTGTVPATADLLDVVANLPRGEVVLPGLDRHLDDESWEKLAPVHPQYALARLLDRLGVDRDDVADWPVAALPPRGTETRARLFSEALRPGGSLDEWRAAGIEMEKARLSMNAVTRIDCENEEEEAVIVALILREALEISGKTAALVTPDRNLARRVAAEMQRWDIAVDDSAGLPLAKTAPGTYLLALAEAAAARLAPVELLAALKHPLAAGGMAPPDFRAAVRRLEREALRGPRPASGLAGLKRVLRGAKHKTTRTWLTSLGGRLGPFFKAMSRRRVRLDDLIAAHTAAAEALAESDGDGGAERLWAGDAGEAAARFLLEFADAARDSDFPAIDPGHYPAILASAMAGRPVRPRYGRHPRLFIWGPLEARLQSVDRMILGGLNEDTWPAEPDPDPWMSRPMREKFGLPPLERRIGLQAHDFVQGAMAPEVFFTRPLRAGGAPAVESRWLLRLETLLDALDVQMPSHDSTDWHHYRRALDAPAGYAPMQRPAPKPAVAHRPNGLSVTQIETWLRDPYSIYARHVLGLKALDPLDADPDAAVRGSVVHEALERFTRDVPGPLPADALDRLIAIGEKVFAPYLDRPGIAAFWWPRFERIAKWFVAVEAERRPNLDRSWSEVSGEIFLPRKTGEFRLSATADRIDRLKDGALAIIDYKTGVLPAVSEMEKGLAPQLPLEALIAVAGGFESVPKGRIAALSFWRLSGGQDVGEIKDFAVEPEVALADARAGLMRLIARFDDPNTPYLSVPRPGLEPRFNDYEHLARVREWSTSGGDGE